MKDERAGEKAESRKQEAEGAQRATHRTPRDSERDPAPCALCGVAALVWRKCKLVCENCGTINKTCADL